MTILKPPGLTLADVPRPDGVAVARRRLLAAWTILNVDVGLKRGSGGAHQTPGSVPIVIILALVTMSTLPSAASAWTASGSATVAAKEDTFYNYNFKRTFRQPQDDVDSPVCSSSTAMPRSAKFDAQLLSSRLPIFRASTSS